MTMKLDEWMTGTGTNDMAMAEMLGVNRSTVFRLRHGARRPSLPLADAIAKVTDFKVLPNDFSHLPEMQDETTDCPANPRQSPPQSNAHSKSAA
jgi:DNA-binding XRE family transcriptional regulator